MQQLNCTVPDLLKQLSGVYQENVLQTLLPDLVVNFSEIDDLRSGSISFHLRSPDTGVMQKAESYRFFYNFRRPNYSKGAKSPALIMEEDWPGSDFSSHFLVFPTLDLDKLNISLNVSRYNDRGQTIPVFPVLPPTSL